MVTGLCLEERALEVVATARHVNEVNTQFGELLAEPFALLRSPAPPLARRIALGDIFGYVVAANAHEQRLVVTPCFARLLDNLAEEAGAVFQRAIIPISAIIGNWRVELVQQVTMGGMNLDEIEANLLATPDSSNECVLDLLDTFESDLLRCDIRVEVWDWARSLNCGGVRIPPKARKP